MNKYLSSLLSQFFNDIQIEKYPELIDLLTYFLDYLQKDNFKDDGYSPYSMYNHLMEIIDIDSMVGDQWKDYYTNYFYPLNKELNETINEYTDWQTFVKTLKYLYKKKGTLDYINFFNFIFGKVNFTEMDISIPLHEDIFNKLGLDPNYQNKDNILSYYNSTKIPLTYIAENLDKLKISMTEFGILIKALKPMGVLIVILNLIVVYEYYITIDYKFNNTIYIELLSHVGNRAFDLTFYDNNNTPLVPADDIQLYIEFDTFKSTQNEIYESNRVNPYLYNDFTFDEIGNITFNETIKQSNGYGNLNYGYGINYELVSIVIPISFTELPLTIDGNSGIDIFSGDDDGVIWNGNII